jgi:hypothetical protein
VEPVSSFWTGGEKIEMDSERDISAKYSRYTKKY